MVTIFICALMAIGISVYLSIKEGMIFDIAGCGDSGMPVTLLTTTKVPVFGVCRSVISIGIIFYVNLV